MNLGEAIRIATNAHFGQEDKGGNPYILHPLWVMHKIRHMGAKYMIVAILHDVVEDTSITFEDLIQSGFNFEIIEALKLLTHDNAIPYSEYIAKIALNPIAREVKLRDLEHNSKITRLKGLREKDFDRLAKYQKAYQYLKELKS